MSAASSNSDVLLPFEILLEQLQRHGFHIGVEHHLRLRLLLDRFADSSTPSELKTLICPLFAINAEQQSLFYRIFDTLYPFLSGTGQNEYGRKLSNAGQIPAPQPGVVRHWQSLAARAIVIFVLAGLVTWKSATTRNKPGPQPDVGPATSAASSQPPAPPPTPVTSPQAPQRIRVPGSVQRANIVRKVDPVYPPEAKRAGARDPVRFNAVIGLDGRVQTLEMVSGDPPLVEPARRAASQWEYKPTLLDGAPVEVLTQIDISPPQPLYSRPRSVLLWIVVLVPTLLWLSYEVYRFCRRSLLIRKAKGKTPPYSWPIRTDFWPDIYDPHDIATVSRVLHRRYHSESVRLDVPLTVEASVAALGFPTFRYRRDSRRPEYLFLIDRASIRDHQARLHEHLASALRGNDLYVATYFYEGDPRVSWSSSGNESFYLEQLQHTCAGHRLVVFGNGDQLLDAVTGRIVQWHGLFTAWPERALLTPEAPSQWGNRELTLATQFAIAPATLEGLSAVAGYFELPSSMESRNWDGCGAQGHIDGADVTTALRRYLGEDVFQWLCACAIYPDLHWDLTLCLGALPSMAPGLVCEQNIVKLLRLQWFRSGSMPDSLRRVLIAELNPGTQQQVRGALIALLESNPPPEGTFAAGSHQFQIAYQRYRNSPKDRKARRHLKALFENLPRDEAMQDYARLDAAESVSRSPLQIVLPRPLLKMFYPSATPFFGTRHYSHVLLAAALALVIGLMLASVFVLSRSANDRLLEEVNATIASVSPTQSSVLSLQSFQDLESLRMQLLPLLRNYHEGAPWSLRLGHYSGNDVLPVLRDFYFAHFRKVILDPILGAMTTRFARLSSAQPTAGYQDIYDQIKVYRTATSGKCSADKTLLDRVLPDVWPVLQSAEPEVQVLANRQIQFYTSELVVPYRGQIPEKEQERKHAQDYLLSFKGPDKVLRGLLEEVNKNQEAADLSKYAPNYQSVLTGPGRMEAAYTRAGWDIVQKRIQEGKFASAGDPCVVGASAELGSLAKVGTSVHEIQDLYVREYIKRWKTFLQSEGIINFGRADAAEKLRLLSDGNRSYMLALIFMISENTNIGTSGEKSVPNPIADQAKSSRLGSFFQRNKKVAQEIQQAVAPASAQPLAVPADIGRAFQPIRFTVDPTKPDNRLNSNNQPYISALGELAAAMGPLAPRSNSNVDAQLFDLARKAIDKAWASVRQLEGGFNNTPDGIDLDLRTLVEAPIKRAGDLVPREPGKEEANSGARTLCAKFDRLRRKYPFNPNAADEVSIPELTAFFAPVSGEIWRFQQQKPFNMLLIKSGSTWMQAPGTQPALTPQFLEAFKAMAQFSDLLFPNGSPEPKLQYTVMVTSKSKIQSMKVTADGYRTPIDRVKEPFEWPATGGEAGARLDVTLSGKSTIPFGVYPGAWGIFKMLQNADNNPAPNLFVFSKLRQGNSVSEAPSDAEGAPIEVNVQVDVPSGANIFTRGYFDRLKCWPRAAQ